MEIEIDRIKSIIHQYWGNEYENVTSDSDFNGMDYQCYSESTADGYEVYVATHDDQNVSINEDVYYYDSDLAETIMEVLEEHYSVYIDEYLYDDIYMDDQFEEYFSEHVEDIVSDSPDSFTEEELKFVKSEYLDEEEETEK